MCGLCFKRRCRWKCHFLLVIWLLALAGAPPKVLGYFLGDTKAVLDGCKDHWTMQDRAAMPLLFQMTVCVDIRVVVPGTWVAFSYHSVHGLRPELGLEGDEAALYGWLLRVRHRFPLKLAPQYWHRVCLRRDVLGDSFSLEVDGTMVAKRTVVAQAISPSGSLWLGCHLRNQPPGAELGKVELYLFRVWSDTAEHGFCEDGNVIGWSSQFWGVTSLNARQTDPHLMCVRRRLPRRLSQNDNRRPLRLGTGEDFPSATATSSPVVAPSGSALINCHINQLCSSINAFFWMSLRIEVKSGKRNEEGIRAFVLNLFRCAANKNAANTRADFEDFCRNNTLEVEEVSCAMKRSTKNTTCGVLLHLTPAVSACELQRAGVSAVQHKRDNIQARIIGQVERVGRNVCEDVLPSSGGFVRCMFPSSLSDVCQSNTSSSLTCSHIESDDISTLRAKADSCSGEGPRFCDCTTSCNATRQFYAVRINVSHSVMNTTTLTTLMLMNVSSVCRNNGGPMCAELTEVSRLYKRLHVECHGTPQRIYSCMVTLEMSINVNICSVEKFVQTLIGQHHGITTEGPVMRMVICGRSGLPFYKLTASNLTWVDSDLRRSDVCQPDPPLLRCNANQTLAVLLTDSCRSTSVRATTAQGSTSSTSTSPAPVSTSSSSTITSPVQMSVSSALTTPSRTLTSTSSSLTTQIPAQTSTSTTLANPAQASSSTTPSQTMGVTSSLPTTQSAAEATTSLTSIPPNLAPASTPSSSTTPSQTQASSPPTSTTQSPSTVSTSSSPSPAQATTSDPLDPAQSWSSPSTAPNQTLTSSSSTSTTQSPALATTSLTSIPPNLALASTSTSSTSPSPTQTTASFASNTPSPAQTSFSSTSTAPNQTLTSQSQSHLQTSTPSTFSGATTSTTPTSNETNANAATSPFATFNATQPSTAPPVVQSTSQNLPVHNTTVYSNTTLLTPVGHSNQASVDASQTNTTTSGSGKTLQNSTATQIPPTLNNTLSSNRTTTYSGTTDGTFTPTPNDTAVYNATTTKTFTPTPNDTVVYNVTTTGTFTPTTNNKTLYNTTTTGTFTPTPTYNETTVETFTPMPNYTTENNATTAEAFTRTDTTVYNATTTTETFTPTFNDTTVYNATTIERFTPIPNKTSEYNVTTAETFTPTHNETVEYNATTAETFRRTHNETVEYNATTAETFTPTHNKTVEYNATTAETFTPTHNETVEYNATTAETFTTTPNDTTVYNATTAEAFTPTHNKTVEYNATTAETFTPTHNETVEYNATTAETFTPTHNKTVEYNATTAEAFTTTPNDTTVYNVTTAETFTPIPNKTSDYNATTAETFTPTHNDTTVYNATTAEAFTPIPNKTSDYNATTAETFTPTHNDTTVYNATTTETLTMAFNDTTVYNTTTAETFPLTPNDTTVYSATTAETFTPTPNKTSESNVSTTATFTPTPSLNTTSEAFPAYNKTTPTPNGTTVNSVTSANAPVTSLNDTTVHNATTTLAPPPNATTVESRHLYSSSVTSNTTAGTNYTTISTFTPSPNRTIGHNVSAGITNDTAAHNVTAADDDRLLNSSSTSASLNSTSTPSPNYTVLYGTTTASNNYITADDKNITAATTANMETRRTTDPPDDLTSAAPGKTNETIHNATTPQNSTLDHVTSVDANATEPTSAPTGDEFTANHTTAGVFRNITTAAGDSNAPSTSLTVNLNASTAASSPTPGFNLTTRGPEGSSAPSATTYSHEHTTASATTNTSTMHDPLPAQEDTTITTTTTTTTTTSTTTTTTTTTTSAPTVKTTTPTSTATSMPGIGLTMTTAAETTGSLDEKDEDANDLLNQTQDVTQLNSSQVGQLVGQLEKLLDGPTVSQTVGKKALDIISNLMEGSSEALSESANRLIQVVDDLGVKLVVAGEREILSSNSLALAVRTVDPDNFPSSSVNIFSTDNVQLRGLGRSRSSAVPLGSVFLPSSLTEGLSPEEQRQASRVQFTFYTKSTLFQDATLNNQTLVGPVLGSSVANLSIHNLRENIKYTIRTADPVNTTFKASCVFWNFTLNGGGGGWSSDGCFVVNASSEHTCCSCNHLTSFAILLDLSREGISDRQQAQILTFITYIGCGVSAVFLAITLLTYLSFEKLLRDIPAKILVQLCASLLFLNLVFLMDGWLALYPATGLCISTAFFLHYFLLTSFTWAGLEALHMYLSIVQVFTPYLSRYMLKFSLMGWGIPLIIVVIIIAVDKDNYGLVTYGKYTDGTTDDFCWLRNDIAFYVGLVAYFLLIFALCLLVFIVVMVQLARIKRQNPQNQSPNRGVMTDLRSIAGLIILLGLTWGFALFAWGPLYLPFVYLFSIFNSLQGFFVFVFHCAVKENVRRQWRTYLCCGRLRLAENSEWSRTATQNKSLSVAMATTSAPHLTSRSSSVISDATNSSGSVFADSGVSDVSNSDVVLNEIHRRNMSLRAEL